MDSLNQAVELKRRGATDQEISQTLSEQGISPKEILETINKLNIKDTIREINTMEEQYPPEGYNAGYQQNTGYDQQYSNPGYQGGYTQEQNQQEVYPQEGYDPASAGDSNLIIELAEQVFSEKMQKIQKQMDELNEIKAVMQVKIDSVSKSVERIENIINSLQTAVLEKVGSYGQNLSSIKKEMEMMQDTFSKTLPEIVHKKRK